jgi:hypothetical protein
MTKLNWEKANQDKGSPGELSTSSSHYNAAVAHSIARKKRIKREAANLRKHNQALEEGKVPDFNRGLRAGRLDERSRIIKVIEDSVGSMTAIPIIKRIMEGIK